MELHKKVDKSFKEPAPNSIPLHFFTLFTFKPPLVTFVFRAIKCEEQSAYFGNKFGKSVFEVVFFYLFLPSLDEKIDTILIPN